MSTDTAFALGLLALVGPRFPDRLRVFLLTVAIVADVREREFLRQFDLDYTRRLLRFRASNRATKKHALVDLFAMRMRGLEPPRGCPHTDLNRARLPIPPHPRGRTV